MSFNELVKEVSVDTGYNKTIVAVVLKSAFREVRQQVKNGGGIRVPNFGTLKNHIRKAKVCINPRTKEKMNIPQKEVCKFKQSPNFFEVI